MTVAVTGAAGFVGRRVVARLRAEGSDVVALVRDPSRVQEPGVRSVAWQAGEKPPLDGVSAVIHAAAHRPARHDDPAEAETCLRVNATGTAALVEAAISARVPRFVYVSAGNVYRDLGRPALETDPIAPSHRSPYYLGSKICGEWFAAAAGATGRIAVTAVRPAAIFGPHMPPGLVATFVRRLRAGEAVSVADGGRYAADLVFVDDVADAIVAAMRDGGDGAYNVGSGTCTTALALAEAIADLVGAPRSRIQVEPATGAPPGFAPLDIGRARAELGFAPRTLHVALRATIDGETA